MLETTEKLIPLRDMISRLSWGAVFGGTSVALTMAMMMLLGLSIGDYWAEIELPTAEMRRRVIPEGVIESGWDLEGWMFFEKVDDDGQKVFSEQTWSMPKPAGNLQKRALLFQLNDPRG
jgi:hypothetical protein